MSIYHDMLEDEAQRQNEERAAKAVHPMTRHGLSKLRERWAETIRNPFWWALVVFNVVLCVFILI